MKNVKDEIYAALLKVTDNVSDSYPKDWGDSIKIIFVEEENKVEERTDNKEQKARVSYRIDIFDTKSTSKAAMAVDEAVSALGLVRTMCRDITEPGLWKHKQMRYEGIIDMRSDFVYWNN